jgi:micrococcal nuclease
MALLVIVALLVARAWVGGGGSGEGGEAGSTSAGHAVSARVVRVIDGDTIEVSISDQNEDVRYIGVDTPETVKPDTPVQCYGPQASAENHRLVDGRTVRLVFDRERRDVYGRLLAYVYARARGAAGKSRFVNAALVRDGYARTLTIPPNTAQASLLGRLQARAGRAGRGLWEAC